MKGARLGAGIVSLGYGLYRLKGGHRDWMTTTAVTTGLTMTLGGLRADRPPGVPERIYRLASRLDFAIPMAVMRALR